MFFIFSTNFIFVAIVFILQCYCLGSFSNYIICYFFVKLILDTPKKTENSVSYFNHFRKDFIRPYGLAHDAQSFDEATLTRRLNNFNCEFFTRPQVAVSEFAETFSTNLTYMEFGNIRTQICWSLPEKSQEDRKIYRNTGLKTARRNR